MALTSNKLPIWLLLNVNKPFSVIISLSQWWTLMCHHTAFGHTLLCGLHGKKTAPACAEEPYVKAGRYTLYTHSLLTYN